MINRWIMRIRNKWPQMLGAAVGTGVVLAVMYWLDAPMWLMLTTLFLVLVWSAGDA